MIELCIGLKLATKNSTSRTNAIIADIYDGKYLIYTDFGNSLLLDKESLLEEYLPIECPVYLMEYIDYDHEVYYKEELECWLQDRYNLVLEQTPKGLRGEFYES